MEKFLVFYQKNKNNCSIIDNYDCQIVIDDTDFNFILVEKTIHDLLNNEETHKKIKDNCEKNLELLAQNSEDYKEDFEELSKTLTNNDYLHFFNQFDLIQIEYDNLDELQKFLESNKEYLENKKIFIPFLVYFSSRSLERVKSYYEVVKKVLPTAKLVCCPYDSLNAKYEKYYVDVEDYFKAYFKWKNLIELIKSLDLSPLEEIAFIYDYLKKKKYQEENKNEPWYNSRGFINVLMGDKIVCVGYVSLFKLLVEDLGHCSVETIDIKKRDKNRINHIRFTMYIKDDKYRVDGNYIFDVTYDSKIADDENNSNYYNFFLRTLEDMDKVNDKNNNERVGYAFLNWSKIEELMEKLPDVYTEEDFKNIISDKTIDHNTILNNMHMRSFWIAKNGNKKEDLLRIYKLIYESFNRRIDHNTIIRLFYNLRKIEYYLDPENTPFTYEDLLDMVSSYLDSPYAFSYKPIEDIRNYFCGLVSKKEIIDELINECLPNVKMDIERIKLTRNLRQRLLKK